MPAKTRRAAPPAPLSPSRLLSHRHLLVVESLLVVALVQRVAEGWLLSAPLPAWARVLLDMGLVVGLFGGIVVAVQRGVHLGLATTHDVARRLPFPTPVALLHLVALLGLFAVYARVCDLDAQVWQELPDLSPHPRLVQQ